MFYRRILKCPEAESAIEKYNILINSLDELKKKYFEEWAQTVEDKCKNNLEKSLLDRKKENAELIVNFDPDLVNEYFFFKQTYYDYLNLIF